MTWTLRYNPPNPSPWVGRADLPDNSCFFQAIQLVNMGADQALPSESHTFGLVGFCCDAGIARNHGRIGAAEGPQALRQALAKLALPTTTFHLLDCGDITCTDGDLESSQQALAELVALLLQKNITPILIGGGHEIAWGHYQGIEKQLPKAQLGIINFDAHFDMRPLLPKNQGSSGTPFLQIAETYSDDTTLFNYNCVGIQNVGNIAALFATAKKYQTQLLLAEELYQTSLENQLSFIDRIILQNDYIYLSLCLDVFAAAVAPGVSAPQALGILPWQAIPLIRYIAASGKALSYDLAELSPPHDIDSHTAKLAANLVYEIIQNHVFKE